MGKKPVSQNDINISFFISDMLFPSTIPSSYLHRFTIHLAVQLTISCRSTVILFILFHFPLSLSLSLSASRVEKYRSTGRTFIFDNGHTPATIKLFDHGPLIGDRRTWRMSYETDWRDMAVQESTAQAGGRPEPPTTQHIGRREAFWFRLSLKSSGMRRAFRCPSLRHATQTLIIVSLFLLSSSLSFLFSLFRFVSKLPLPLPRDQPWITANDTNNDRTRMRILLAERFMFVLLRTISVDSLVQLGLEKNCQF